MASVAVEALTTAVADHPGCRVLEGDAVVCIHRDATADNPDRVETTPGGSQREKNNGPPCVVTESGARVGYDRLVITSGPWTNRLLDMAGLQRLPLIVSNEQQTYFLPKKVQALQDAAEAGGNSGSGSGSGDADQSCQWESPRYNAYACGNLPVVLWHHTSDERHGFKYVYAIPHVRGGIPGVKVSEHAQGPLLRNDEFRTAEGSNGDALWHTRKTLHSQQDDAIDGFMLRRCQRAVTDYLPGLDPSRADTYMRCLYTNVASSAAADFVVGNHPGDPSVFVATGFGGEGFKFGPFIGEMLADEMLGEPLHLPDTHRFFDPARLFAEGKAHTSSRTKYRAAGKGC